MRTKGYPASEKQGAAYGMPYQDDATDCGSLITDSRFSELSIPVLTAITNLYFKQQVVFDIL